MLVGAPYHRHEKFGDEGRVYVYMNNQKVQIAWSLIISYP